MEYKLTHNAVHYIDNLTNNGLAVLCRRVKWLQRLCFWSSPAV